MKTFAAAAVVLASVAPALAQIYTTTYPWAQGDTVVISQATNALGATIASQVLSTIGAAAGVVPTGLGSSSSSSSSSRRLVAGESSSSSSRSVRNTLTQGNQNPVGAPPTSTAPPMTATTYGYQNTDGVWTTGTWVQSYTPPAEVTKQVAAGTILDYNDYQSAANSAVFNAAAGADASANRNAAGTGAADRKALIGMGAVLGAGIALGAMLV